MRTLGVSAALVLLVAALFAAVAGASRKPTPTEMRALKRLALAKCGPGCVWRGSAARISTVDQRYAYVDVYETTGAMISNAGVWKRPSVHSEKWHQLMIVGGGAQRCTTWYQAGVPPEILHEFRKVIYCIGE